MNFAERIFVSENRNLLFKKTVEKEWNVFITYDIAGIGWKLAGFQRKTITKAWHTIWRLKYHFSPFCLYDSSECLILFDLCL